jgi:hypothetical protein
LAKWEGHVRWIEQTILRIAGTLLYLTLLWPAQPALAQLFQQYGPKLVGGSAAGFSGQGVSVALSADSSTAILGGPCDGSSDDTCSTPVGAAWVFVHSGGVWFQLGDKLVGTGAVGNAAQGISVALSADGNTAIVGGPGDNTNAGAAWVFIRSGGVWSQQGGKLVGSGAVGGAQQGISVALSADGNTAIVGGNADNTNTGAAWVFVRSGGMWTQQGNKLVGTGAVGAAQQGISFALSADGNTAMLGGRNDNSNAGAAWVFTRSAGVWSQQGNKLVGTGGVGASRQGFSVALSGGGNTAIVGGSFDNSQDGAAWVFTRSGGGWSQLGNKLVAPPKASPWPCPVTPRLGGSLDNGDIGAAWVFVAPPTGTHEFNGDCLSDIVWRNTTTGQAAIWLMNGTAISSAAGIGTVTTDWSVVGQRDFNGDGLTDILWRHTSGTVAIWLMNGTTVLSGGSPGAVPTDWAVAGTGDFNGDGFGDILWRNTTSGQVAIWLMNGTTIASGAGVGTIPTT